MGVSIDEEMLDLTKYQRGYQAGAKIIETTQAMYDIIMNMWGTVMRVTEAQLQNLALRTLSATGSGCSTRRRRP